MTLPDTPQWNLGGWLGGQVGGTVWALLAGLLALPHDAAAGGGVIGLFAVSNLIGFGLWRSRSRLSLHVGLQSPVLVIAVTGLGAVYQLDRAGDYETIQLGSSTSAASTYGIIVVVAAALMLLFFLQFRRR